MIYLDNAATTFPKPRVVVDAVSECLSDYCGNPGRAGHALSVRAAEAVYSCREAVASFFGSDAPENVVFSENATGALNLALHGMLRRGDHVLISGIEHNAVLRPVHAMLGEGVTYSVYPASPDPDEVMRGLEKRLRPNTRLVVACHASNICGIVLPLTEIGAFCEKHRLRFVVDASQSAGKIPVDIEKSGADAICAPGHKGLYGPPGVGFVLFGERYRGENGKKLRPLLSGGSGSRSKEAEMPPFLPDRLEAGTLPLPAIAGLEAGIRAVTSIGPERLAEYEGELAEKSAVGLSDIPGVRVWLPDLVRNNGIVLFTADGIPPEEAARRLDEKGICVRAGYHCAPLAHGTVGTTEGGAVRASFSMYNTERDVSALVEAMKEIANDR